MPTYSDFNELENGGGVPSGAAPLVFWDGYGLDNPLSGVGIYGRMLATELAALGTSPVLVGNRKSCD